MADIVVRQDGQLPLGTQIRYREMGDATYALVMAAETQTSHESALSASELFKATYVQPHGGELANDASHDFLIVVGANQVLGLLGVSAAGSCEVSLYEAPVSTANGNLVTLTSKNRSTVGVPETRVYEGPAVAGGAEGVQLFHLFVPGMSALVERSYGGGWNELDWILAPNTDYLVRVTNRSGWAIQLSFSLDWSEH